MTYEEALGFINKSDRSGPKMGLSRIKALLKLMGNPHEKLRFIHEAGTNGKGSTCAMLSNILTVAGYKTGLYTSPFVLEFCESIQINNRMIPKDSLAEITGYVKKYWDILDAQGDAPSGFEVTVAVMMEYFAREKCDIVVLEVCMGGRLDTTNVIDAPLVSVITSISFDHMKYLGNTISEIAYEKCGIIKRGGVTVTYPRQNPDALAVIMERCAEEENKLLIPMNAEVISMTTEGSDIVYNGLEIHIPLVGEHQVYNAMTAIEAIRALELNSLKIKPEHILSGIAGTKCPARFEKFGDKPVVIIDGAHNPEKMRALGKTLELYNGRCTHAVVGMTGQKNLDQCLNAVLPLCESVTVTTVMGNPKGTIDAEQLRQEAVKYCKNVYLCEFPNDALNDAFSRCGEDDILLICGSLYLASELRPVVMELICEKQV